MRICERRACGRPVRGAHGALRLGGHAARERFWEGSPRRRLCELLRAHRRVRRARVRVPLARGALDRASGGRDPLAGNGYPRVGASRPWAGPGRSSPDPTAIAPRGRSWRSPREAVSTRRNARVSSCPGAGARRDAGARSARRPASGSLARAARVRVTGAPRLRSRSDREPRGDSRAPCRITRGRCGPAVLGSRRVASKRGSSTWRLVRRTTTPALAPGAASACAGCRHSAGTPARLASTSSSRSRRSARPTSSRYWRISWRSL